MALRNFVMSGVLTNVPIVPATSPTQIGLFDTRQIKAQLKRTTASKDIHGLIDGSPITQVLDNIVNQVTYDFEMDIEAIDSDTLALMFGETWAPTATYADKLIKRAAVPTATPYEVVDAGISTTAVAADVQVTIVENGSWGFKQSLEVITGSGTPTSSQVKLDATNTKLVFPAALAGAPIKYAFSKARTAIDSLGVVQSPTVLEDLRFIGHVASTRKEEVICEVDLRPTAGWDLPIGDEAALKLQYKALASGSNRSAVRMYRISA